MLFEAEDSTLEPSYQQAEANPGVFSTEEVAVVVPESLRLALPLNDPQFTTAPPRSTLYTHSATPSVHISAEQILYDLTSKHPQPPPQTPVSNTPQKAAKTATHLNLRSPNTHAPPSSPAAAHTDATHTTQSPAHTAQPSASTRASVPPLRLRSGNTPTSMSSSSSAQPHPSNPGRSPLLQNRSQTGGNTRTQSTPAASRHNTNTPTTNFTASSADDETRSLANGECH